MGEITCNEVSLVPWQRLQKTSMVSVADNSDTKQQRC